MIIQCEYIETDIIDIQCCGQLLRVRGMLLYTLGTVITKFGQNKAIQDIIMYTL